MSSDEILSMASRMYTYPGLTRVDDHTVQAQMGGVTYVPIPPGSGSNYAGLLAVTLPSSLRRRLTHDVVVRQVTNASGEVRQTATRGRRRGSRAVAASVGELQWRKVIGTFQLSSPVGQKNELLLPEERALSVLRWIGEAIPTTDRWHPVFARYLEAIGGRVQSFGGNPGQILPSPLGNGVPGVPGYPGRPGRPTPPGHPGRPGHPRPGEPEHPSLTGKIEGIVYDHFGDFEGFILETLEGERHRFHSHEARVLTIIQRAWTLRILMTVTVRRDHREHPVEIILHGAPPHEE